MKPCTFIFLISAWLGLFSAETAAAWKERLPDNDSLLKVYLQQPPDGIAAGADAIVLFEQGSASITLTGSLAESYNISYKLERCIKLNTQQALDLADIALPYTEGLKLSELDFQSINLVNGAIVREKIRKRDFLKEKLAGSTKIYKLSLPNARPGTIIYYTYTYTVPVTPRDIAYQFIPFSWAFQGRYPVLESIFSLSVPQNFRAKLIPKNVRFSTVLSQTEYDRSDSAYWVINSRGSQVTHHWKRRKVTDLRKEPYQIDNALQAERLNIYVTSGRLNMPETWEEANGNFFYDNSAIGRIVFQPEDTLSDVLDKIGSGKTDNLEMAKDIYRFVRDSFECRKSDKVWAGYSIRYLLRKRKGSVSENNILLTALLRRAGLKSFPVVLCTSDRDKLSQDQFEAPILNYLVSLLIIDQNYYLLDASSKLLPFGVLRPECYNGFAWLVTEKGIPIDLSPDSLTDKNICMATITPGKKPGQYQLLMEQKLGDLSGTLIREGLLDDSVEVKRTLEEEMSKLKYKAKLKHYTISNQHNPDQGIRINYELDLELDTAATIYVDPFVKRFFSTNPFTEATRRSPVVFGSAFNYQFILRFTLPEGYQAEDYSNPVQLHLNNYMSYRSTMNYDQTSRLFTLSCTLASKTATVPAADYTDLRSFYDRIITEQNKKIVLKKN